MGDVRPIRVIERRRAFLLVASLDLVFAATDLWRGQAPALLLPHALLFSTMLLGTGLVARVRPGSRAPTLAVVCGGLLALALLAIMTGGVHGLYFSYFVAVPFAIALLAPGDPPFVAAAGLACTVAGGAVVWRSHWMLEPALFWAGQMLASISLALYGSAMYRRIVTAEREAERREGLAREQLRSAERLAAVGTVAAGVGHEINNPLAYVKSNLAWLRDEEADGGVTPAERREVLDECLHGIDRIQGTVADLRLLARREEHSRDEVVPADAIDEALRIARIRTKIAAEVTRELPVRLPVIHASRRRLVQVLVNLLVNAADAVQAQPEEQRRIRIWAEEEPGWVRIGVDDSGPGLSDEVRARLFEPLFTTKEAGSGTGLGLLLSREYIEKAGGSLTAGDAPGRGARFVVRLPRGAQPV